TGSTCNIRGQNVARQGPRATYEVKMLQDKVHVQHRRSECCKTGSTCNIRGQNVARQGPRAT
ncbi:hypothetical protein, partial [Mammaliicoccus lentus]|uniref:hypothetical protein n=1 Tax=Mammaliicoccus lentus TaxID=42858 RepID=UPI001D16566E